MKVFVSGDEVHTGQVFFRPAVTKTVYAAGVYKSRGQADTSNSADSIYREAGARALCSLTRKGSGYSGAMTIGVDVVLLSMKLSARNQLPPRHGITEARRRPMSSSTATASGSCSITSRPRELGLARRRT